MRLKEIKPGMVIHCKKHDEIKEIRDAGVVGINGGCITEYMMPECYVIIKKGYADWALDKNIALRFGNIIEFSDLILPELTAEEVLEICHKICGEAKGHCDSCRLAKCCYRDKNIDCSETVDILQKWKSTHENKEPEIETVDICRIIEIHPDGRKRCVHEEDIPEGSNEYQKRVEILTRYIMEHDGEFIAVHEVVTRVKK